MVTGFDGSLGPAVTAGALAAAVVAAGAAVGAVVLAAEAQPDTTIAVVRTIPSFLVHELSAILKFSSC
jgi:hypothetical protein